MPAESMWSCAMTQSLSSSSRRALIVEDEFLIALELEEVMADLGFDIADLAPSSHDAFALAMAHQPDIVVMDVCLSGGREGIEAGRWLREVCHVPVVFVTACNDSDTLDRINAQVPGAPVLAKPVHPPRLAEAVASLARAHA
jgi:DNA-binding response OmpR family regulator